MSGVPTQGKCPKSVAPQRGFGDFLRATRGAVAVIVALALVAIVAMLGLGVEVGAWYAQKRANQSTIDAACFAAAYSLYETGSIGGIQAAAVASAAANGVTSGVVAVSPPTSGAYQGDTRAVQTTITSSPGLLFTSVMIDSMTIVANAVCQVLPLGEACVLSLSPTEPVGIQLSGSANLDLTGCGMFSNATSPTSMTTGGGAQLDIKADYFAMVGGFQANGSAVPVLTNPTEPLTGAAPVSDPLIAYQSLAPAPEGAALNSTNFGNNSTWEGKVGNTNNAPDFANGLTFGSQSNITIPGNITEIYVTGALKINAGATVNCTCTFILTGDNSSVTINGGATVNIAAPNAVAGGSGPRYGGLAFYNAGTSTNASVKSKFNGTNTMNISGGFYFPNQEIDYAGDNAGSSTCVRLIAKNIVFTGNTSSSMNGTNCPQYQTGTDFVVEAVPIMVE